MSSLYFHIPFCEHKCLYCDFYSLAPDGARLEFDRLIGRFLDAIEQEIHLRASSDLASERVDTVFFGGGTPSLLQPSDIERVLSLVRTTFNVSPSAEITLETNPGTVDRRKLEAFRAAGVNRLSIGIQSFFEEDLRFLTRIHSAKEAESCVRDAFESGCSDVSIDLIFALPGQTIDRWKENLSRAVELKPTHISCYSLIVEPNTPLARMVDRGEVTTTSNEQDAEQYDLAMTFLAANGYEQYEVSNFSLPGFYSRHNSAYWDHTNYLGFGPSAHSYWNGRRWWNAAQLQEYLSILSGRQLPVGGEEVLTERELIDESVFLGLRSGGIDLTRLRERYGKDLRGDHAPAIRRLVEEGLAVLTGDRLCLTQKGRLICDEIVQIFR